MLLVPARLTQTETIIKGSRFLAVADYAPTVTDAKEWIHQQRARFSDATHVIPAFLVGHGKSVQEHCSDAGEPPGTAGTPILTVLRGSGLGDIVMVVARYFGGTKLGMGGLSRAYSESTHTLLRSLPRCQKIVAHHIALTIPYDFYHTLLNLIPNHHGEILTTDFAAEIDLLVQISVEDWDPFQRDLSERSQGRLQARMVEEEIVIRRG